MRVNQRVRVGEQNNYEVDYAPIQRQIVLFLTGTATVSQLRGWYIL